MNDKLPAENVPIPVVKGVNGTFIPALIEIAAKKIRPDLKFQLTTEAVLTRTNINKRDADDLIAVNAAVQAASRRRHLWLMPGGMRPRPH